MIAFGDGVLQLGRRALASTDAQKFYGLALSHNGTAAFTNKLTAPTVVTDYLRAGKAVVFEDGTVMTTAANMTGGVKEIGDLNLVSKSGSVVTSAGGKPVMVIEPLGTVVFPNANAEEANAQGIVVDGTAGKLSIGGSLHVENNANTSTITTSHALHLNTTRVIFGAMSADKVTLTVSRPVKDPAASEGDSTSDDAETDGDTDTETDDDRRQTRATSESDSTTNLQQRINMEIVGQSSSSQNIGGDVWIAGGDGLESGGNVVIAGGIGLDLEDIRFGNVAVNAQLDPSASSFTEIGSQGAKHVVHIQGDVLFNGNETSKDNNATQVTVAGAVFNVQTQRIYINNGALNASTVQIDSTDLRIGTATESVQIGGLAHSTVLIQAKNMQMDATGSIAIGGQTKQISIGNASQSGQSIDFVSGTPSLLFRCLSWDCTNSIVILSVGSIRLSSSDTVSSRSILGSAALPVNMSTSDIELANGSVTVNAKRLDVGGASGQTKSVVLSALEIELGKQSLNSSVNVQGEAFSVTSGNIELGAEGIIWWY